MVIFNASSPWGGSYAFRKWASHEETFELSASNQTVEL